MNKEGCLISILKLPYTVTVGIINERKESVRRTKFLADIARAMQKQVTDQAMIKIEENAYFRNDENDWAHEALNEERDRKLKAQII